jgi:hypothetical protein
MLVMINKPVRIYSIIRLLLAGTDTKLEQPNETVVEQKKFSKKNRNHQAFKN